MASAHAVEAAVKITSPRTSIRRRPARSPIVPATRISAASTTTYALTTHCRFAAVTPSSDWIEGSATFTIVTSSSSMNCATHDAASVPSRRAGVSPATCIDSADGHACRRYPGRPPRRNGRSP